VNVVKFITALVSMSGSMHVAAADDLIGYHLTSSDALQYWAVDTLERSVCCNDYNGLTGQL